MTILIIGSKGFIGSNLVSYFSSSQNRVIGCGVSGENTSNYYVVNSINPNYQPIFNENEINVCINASGSPGVGFSLQFPEDDFRMNVTNTQNLLHAIKTNQPKCKFICLSSAAVYGNPNYLPIDETHATNPLSIYGINKLKAEQCVINAFEKNSIKSIILRIFSAYGKGLKKQLFWDIYKKSKRGSIIELFGTGAESRDFVSVTQICTIIEHLIKEVEFNSTVYNVATGIETTIQKAASLFLNEIGSDYLIKFNNEIKPGDPLNWRASIEKLKNTGLVVNENFESEIKKYAQWILKENE